MSLWQTCDQCHKRVPVYTVKLPALWYLVESDNLPRAMLCSLDCLAGWTEDARVVRANREQP